MKYSYAVMDLRGLIFKKRDEGDTRPDHEIVLEHLNEMGAHGFRVLGDPNTMSVFFERAE